MQDLTTASIADLPLDRDITSREGLSTDQMTRVRLAYLVAQNNSLVQQTQFADAKAGALLAIIGLIATRSPGAAFDSAIYTAQGVIVVILHAIALFCCIVVLIPRYAGRAERRALARAERFSWPALIAEPAGKDLYAEFARGAQASQLLVSMARSNQALAGILHRKFAWLRGAFLIALADFAFIAWSAAFTGG